MHNTNQSYKFAHALQIKNLKASRKMADIYILHCWILRRL